MSKKFENEVVLFHGTVNPFNIFKNGFESGMPTVWDCSEWEYVYFYEFESFCEKECFEVDEYSLNRAVIEANQQAQIQNAFLTEPNKYTYVLEFHFPAEFREELEDDTSCENMKYYGTVQVDIDTVNKWMQEGKCTIILHKFPFSIKSSLLYVTGLVDHPYALSALEKMPSYEYNVLKALSKIGFCEDFYDYCVYGVEPEAVFEVPKSKYVKNQ